MIADVNLTGVIVLALSVLLLLLSAGTFALRHRTRGRGPEVPNAMRPGPSDAALETPLLHKLQGWGVLLVAFFVVWFPITWLFETSEKQKQEQELRSLAIERGQLATQLFSEDNQLGVGCIRCHGPELRGGVIPYQGGYAYPPNLTNICAGNLGNPSHAAITSVDDIYQVVMQGRGAMPSWSIRYAGALTDQQINDLVNYLVDMSSKNVPFEDNVCLNPDAVKRAQEAAQAAGTVLERP
jgi:mono/diheme cytochrome c family protein